VSHKSKHASHTGTGDRKVAFGFGHVQDGYGPGELDIKETMEFFRHLRAYGKMTWNELMSHGRHSWGSELLPAERLHVPIPRAYDDRDQFMVLRWHGDNRPMVGIRDRDVFEILWVAPDFHSVYEHHEP